MIATAITRMNGLSLCRLDPTADRKDPWPLFSTALLIESRSNPMSAKLTAAEISLIEQLVEQHARCKSPRHSSTECLFIVSALACLCFAVFGCIQFSTLIVLASISSLGSIAVAWQLVRERYLYRGLIARLYECEHDNRGNVG